MSFEDSTDSSRKVLPGPSQAPEPPSVPPFLLRVVGVAQCIHDFASRLHVEWDKYGHANPMTMKSIEEVEVFSVDEEKEMMSLREGLRMVLFGVPESLTRGSGSETTSSGESQSSLVDPFELLQKSLDRIRLLRDEIGGFDALVNVGENLKLARSWNSVMAEVRESLRLEKRLEAELWMAKEYRERLSRMDRLIFGQKGVVLRKSAAPIERSKKVADVPTETTSICSLPPVETGRPLEEFFSSWRKRKRRIEDGFSNFEASIAVVHHRNGETEEEEDDSSIARWSRSATTRLATLRQTMKLESFFWDCVIELEGMCRPCFDELCEDSSDGLNIESDDWSANFDRQVEVFDKQIQSNVGIVECVEVAISEVHEWCVSLRSRVSEDEFLMTVPVCQSLNRTLVARKSELEELLGNQRRSRMEFEKAHFAEIPERIKGEIGIESCRIASTQAIWDEVIQGIRVLVRGEERANDDCLMKEIANLARTGQQEHKELLRASTSYVRSIKKLVSQSAAPRRIDEEPELAEVRISAATDASVLLERAQELGHKLLRFTSMVGSLEGPDPLLEWLSDQVVSLEKISLDAVYAARRSHEALAARIQAILRPFEEVEECYSGYRELSSTMMSELMTAPQVAWAYRIDLSIARVKVLVAVQAFKRLRDTKIPAAWAESFRESVKAGVTRRLEEASDIIALSVTDFVGAFALPASKKKWSLSRRKPSIYVGHCRFCVDSSDSQSYSTSYRARIDPKFCVSGRFVRHGFGVLFSPKWQPQSDYYGNFVSDQLEGRVLVYNSSTGDLEATTTFSKGQETPREVS